MALGMAVLHGQPNPGDDKLMVRFYRKPVEDEVASAAAGRPIFKDVEYVKIYVPGDIVNVIDRPAWLDPRQKQSDLVRFPKQYAAFKSGTDQDRASAGVPLAKLPGITQGQVEEFKHFQIHTIEALAQIDDGICQRFMGAQTLKRRAQDWLEAAAGNAPVERMRVELEKRDAALEEEKHKREELEAQVAELMRAHRAPKGQVSELQDQAAELAAHEAKAEQAHRGPGRPPKAK